jgi:hypothetical protein
MFFGGGTRFTGARCYRDDMSQFGNYSLPPTAICPGCGAMVTLPAEPIYPDSPPAICATCDTEVPDYRRDAYDPAAAAPFEPAQRHTPHSSPIGPVPTSSTFEGLSLDKRVSRAGLFRSLGGILAEHGSDMVENTKDRFNETIDKSGPSSKSQ